MKDGKTTIYVPKKTMEKIKKMKKNEYEPNYAVVDRALDLLERIETEK